MTDLRKDKDKGEGRLGGVLSPGDVPRRKEQRIDRRTFRAWPLLPVLAGGKGKVAPSLEWPEGQTFECKDDEWLERPERGELGQDFTPRPEAGFSEGSPVEPGEPAPRRALKVGLLASVALHLACVALLIVTPKPDTLEIAGGGAISVTLLGEQVVDSLAAGDTDGEVASAPVEEARVPETSEQAAPPATAAEPPAPPEKELPPEPPPPALSAPAAPPEQHAPEPAPPPQQPPPPPPAAAAPDNLAVDPAAVSETGELNPKPEAPVEQPRPPEPTEKVEPPPEPVKPLEPVKAPEPPEPVKAPPTPEKPPQQTKPVQKVVEKRKTEEKKAAARKKAEAEREARQTQAHRRKGDAGEASKSAERGSSAGGSSASLFDPGNAAVSNYPGKVAAKLRRALKYPKSAVSGGSGQAQVAFTVLADGSASGIRLVSSSGSPVLDQAAMEAVRRASPFPAIPPEAGRKQWPFTVPVLFKR